MKTKQNYSKEILETLLRIEEELIKFNEHTALLYPLTKPKRSVTKTKSRDEIVMPWNDVEFINAWDTWRLYKKNTFKFTYKTSISEQEALATLRKIAGPNIKTAIKVIQQSISNQWQGFFPIKDNGQDTNLFEGVSYQ